MRASCLAVAALSTMVLALPIALAQDALPWKDAVPWKVEGKLLGKPRKDGNGYKKSEDVSGIACATPSGYPRTCLVIDDNTQFAQAVTLDKDRIEAGPTILLIANTFSGKPLELDGEGVGFANDIFYVMGSHGGPRRPKETSDPAADRALVEARVEASSQIARVRLAPDGSLSLLAPLSLTEAIASQPELRAASERRLDDNGLTIEGVAIDRDRVFAGFRGPLLAGRAAILSVSLKGLQGQGPLDSHLFKLPLGAGRGIRDMTNANGHILLLAGPSADTPGHYAIMSWDGQTDDGIHEIFDLQKDAGIDPDRKAEALLVLDDMASAMRVLVMFDGEKEGAPLALTIKKR